MKKRILAIFLAMLLLCGCTAQPSPTENTAPTTPGQTEPAFTGIDESQPNAQGIYQIYSVEGLQNMANNPQGKFELLQDIDLGGISWSPVGTKAAPFTGTLDGKGYTVSNFTVASTDGCQGFFGVLSGNVQDLRLEDVTIQTAQGIAGGIAAVFAGNMENCYVSGTMDIAENVMAGGLVGQATGGTVTGCEVALHMEAAASSTVGLLGGQMENVTVASCVYTGPMNRQNGELFTKLAGNQENAVFTDCLYRDNTESTLLRSEQEQQMRHTVEQKMRAMGMVEWTVDTTLDWIPSGSGGLQHAQSFQPGQIYHGLPYTGKSGDLSRFLYCFNEDGTLKDFAKVNPMGNDNFDMYMGVDCSAAIYWSWATVSTTMQWRYTHDMFPAKGLGCLAVGQWEGADTLLDSAQIFQANDEQTMAKAYAQLRKGDCITTYFSGLKTKSSINHTRMVAADPVILFNQDGQIDVDRSYLIVHGQGDGLGSNYKNSSWWIDHKQSLREVFDDFYVPLSCKELREGVQPECVVTVDTDGVGKAYLATGVVETNYRLISTTIRITEENGNVAFEKTLFTAVDKWVNTSTNDYARTTVNSFDVAAFAVYLGQAQLKTGKTYTYELSAVPGTGESYVLKTFTFLQ